MSESGNDIKDAEAFLDSIPKFSHSGPSAANFDLERMKRFCEKLGNPQNNFKSIHVGGTNGKGTVCRMLASVYQQSGYKVGLYTSPHLINVRERFMINSKMMRPELFTEFFDLYEAYIRDSNYTYFEITTAIAFWYFSKNCVDIAILEVGLGGRLDATNVIDPLISVITSVGLDHTDVLGNSLESIAFEKAGIIKKDTPVVIGNLDSVADKVVSSVAKFNKSRILKGDDLKPAYKDQKIILKGINPPVFVNGTNFKKIDALNVAVVYQIIRELSSLYPVLPVQAVKGIEQLHNRFSKHAVFEKIHPDKSWYFDGAHNVQAVETLVHHLLYLAPARQWLVVLSFMKDKLNEDIANHWNKFPEIYLYRMKGERAATFQQMKTYFPSAREIENCELLMSDHFKSELVIFSGSFYFYSIISNWMGAIASADKK